MAQTASSDSCSCGMPIGTSRHGAAHRTSHIAHPSLTATKHWHILSSGCLEHRESVLENATFCPHCLFKPATFMSRTADCWLLLLTADCWLLAADCWLLLLTVDCYCYCWLLTVDCWLLAADCWLLTADCWLCPHHLFKPAVFMSRNADCW